MLYTLWSITVFVWLRVSQSSHSSLDSQLVYYTYCDTPSQTHSDVCALLQYMCISVLTEMVQVVNQRYIHIGQYEPFKGEHWAVSVL